MCSDARNRVDLTRNVVPNNYSRGKSGLIFLLWLVVQPTIFNWAPRPLYNWRRFVLRLFGAKIGKNVRIRPGVIVEFPWRLKIGDNSAIGDYAWIYNLSEIEIGANCTISQYAKLVTGSHEVDAYNFPLKVLPISISDYAWIGANSYVGLGVTMGEGAVLGACSCAYKDIPAWTIYTGNPAKYTRDRLIMHSG